jgi:glutathione S-transferase
VQPFRQVPILEEDGWPTLFEAGFETGAILLDVATRSGRLLPSSEGRRAPVICRLFAARNSIEPPMMILAEVDAFNYDLRTASQTQESWRTRKRDVPL